MASQIQKNQTIGNYSIGKTLGQGTFGKVKLGTHKQTQEKVAIKVLDKKMIEQQNDFERVNREITILRKVRHPNIIQLYEIIESQDKLYLIMELASGGELFQYIVKQKRISEQETSKYLSQLISGIEYIHVLGVVHRDLKPENILFDNQLNVKIVDFGLSNVYNQGNHCITACGSPCYASPEMIAGKKYDGFINLFQGLLSDIWSCGIIFFATLCGFLPFDDQDTQSLYHKILSGVFQMPSHLSKEARILLNGILQVNPKKRFDIKMLDLQLKIQDKNVNFKEPQGIIIGQQEIQLEESIINQVLSLDQSIDRDNLIQQLKQNKHSSITSHYYLIKQKKKEQQPQIREKRSISNMTKPSFTPIVISNPKLWNLKNNKTTTQRNKSPENMQYSNETKNRSPEITKLPHELRKTFKLQKPDYSQKKRINSFDNVNQMRNSHLQKSKINKQKSPNQQQLFEIYAKKTVYSPDKMDQKQKVVIRTVKAQSTHESNVQPQTIQRHSGFVNLNCVVQKQPLEIVNNLMSASKSLKLRTKIIGRYQIQFSKFDLTFNTEIKSLYNNSHYLLFSRQNGNQNNFTKETQKILKFIL